MMLEDTYNKYLSRPSFTAQYHVIGSIQIKFAAPGTCYSVQEYQTYVHINDGTEHTSFLY